MKRAVLLIGMVALLVCASRSGSSPLSPVKLRSEKLLPFHHFSESRTFAGREPAKVIVIGESGKTYMGLYIYDGDGNCVAHDDMGAASTKDDMAAEWLPPHTGLYSVEVRNFG